MNLIRGIAKQITRVASGVHTPAIQSISSWIVQPPLITSPYFGLSDALVSDNLCLVLAGSKLSANLLPQVPKVHRVSKPFMNLEIVPCKDIKITSPEIAELTDWLIELEVFSEASIKALIVPEIFQKELADFEVSVLIEQNHLLASFNKCEVAENSLVALEAPKILENSLVDLEIPENLDCCFGQDDCGKELEQYQEHLEGRKQQQESKDQLSSRSHGYCEILYPILLPPLSLEVHNNLDFYNPLRGYQKQGIRFLFENSSALLADEMGTGKTVQAVNAVRLMFRQAHIKSVLIVCPPAVIGSVDLSIETGNSEGWSGHFYHWAPELQVAVMRGGKKEQRKVDWQRSFHVYITTYDTLRGDLNDGVLTDLQQFNCIILDEAQKIKNRETKTAKAIRRLEADYRWALTGTPIENRLDDVISLFDFIRPGTFLGGIEYSSQSVSKIIEPFMLRRLKQEVLQDLPDKERQEAWLDLDDAQKIAYNQALNAGRQKIETSLDGEEIFQIKRHIFTLLAELKQICNFAKGQITSPKTFLLLELLETIAANNKKVLVFSQYRLEGTDKIAQVLSQTEIRYVVYQGSPQQRERAKSDFKSNPEITVFLATFGTAAEGLTLTEATYVINFDHLWNPARMNQAEDRIHRLGQTKGVTIYSFWMKNTIEERIKKKLVDKRILIDKTINNLAVEVNEENILSTEDWLDIFDIKLARKIIDGEKSDRKMQVRRAAAKTFFQNNQSKLSPSTNSSRIISEIETIKKLIETMKDSPKNTFIVYGNYIEKSIKELTLMTEQSPIFNQQNATIGVNYAASGSKQRFTQNVTATEQNFDILLADFEQFINELQQNHPDATDETAIQIIDVQAKELQQTQPLRWQNFVNLKQLWNGGKKAAFKVGEHYAEQNPFGKGAIAFLEGVMEESK